MKKKLTVSQKRLLICLVMVAIFMSAYQFIYTKYENMSIDNVAKADEIKLQIKQRESDLGQEDTLRQQTEEVNKNINDIIATYPVKLTKEDNLVFIEDLEQALGIDIPSVEVLETSDFYTTILPIRGEAGLDMLSEAAIPSSAATDGSAGAGVTAATNDSATADAATATATNDSTATDTAATDNSATTDTTSTGGSTTADTNTAAGSTTADTAALSTQFMKVLVCPININFQVTEKKFIKLVDYINTYPLRTSIGATSLNYDSSTGDLICNMTINRYVLVGSGKEYEEPDIGDISIGTDSLFGTPKK